MATWKMIDTNNDWHTGYPTHKVVGWSDLRDINSCTIFDHDGDMYVVYYNDELNFENREYAVYSKRDGQLFCLLRHAMNALNLTMDDPTCEKAYEVFHQAALDFGFPEKMTGNGMTWRQLRDYLDELDDEVLDWQALVYIHNEKGTINGEVAVRSLSFMHDNEYPVDEEMNALSIDLDED